MNMAKELMDKNQQPPVIQELGRLSLSIRDEGRKSESSELLRVGADESSASATFFFFFYHNLNTRFN